ncbi:hypothetical protein [Streptomyces sp. NRRL S-340]|uniref:hypothetical protein n=1 Tax=Streptomyces sp. NRRL S-340 TaxID=1463901 RepID=UPI00055E3191|nr:hypothetical protein [Streptomyces sp. NRRL S-340]
MRERPESGDEPSTGQEVRRRRIDLSVAQVAGSAVAAVVAAKLASYFGVYGTILGAGVVSVVATCGGSVFQHFFRRTGEQIRTATVSVRPVAGTDGISAAPAPGGGAPAPGEFSEGTVYRARVKSWKRPVIAAALVFGVTMAGITAYELVSGSSFSGRGGTTVGDAVTGHRGKAAPSGGDTPEPSGSPAGTTGTDDGASPGAGVSGGPGQGATGTPTPIPDSGAHTGTRSTDGTGTGSGGRTPAGSGTDSGAGSGPDPGSGPDGTPGTGGTAPAPGASATAPAPSASSRSGNGVPDPAGPAAR